MEGHRSSRRFYRSDSSTDLSRYWDHGAYISDHNQWCFETAWEVANKVRLLLRLTTRQVGGIYTVIRSKTGVSVAELGDQYVLLGPYKEVHARQEVEEEEPSPAHPLGQAIASQRDKGYRIVPGRWLVEGNPQVILFDVSSAAGKLDQFKQEL
jgi:glycogen(starch) synthase